MFTDPTKRIPPRVSIDDEERRRRIEPLRENLRPYLEETEFGLYLRHPFCNEQIHDCERCALIHERTDLRAAQANAHFEAGDYESYLGYVDIAFQAEWLEKDAWTFGHHQYWRLLRVAYDNQMEHTINDRERLERLFAADRPGRDRLMDGEERKALAQLPDVITVYRGYGDEVYADGIAWTLHKPAAIWYAHHGDPQHSSPTVRVGRIPKRYVYAYCGGGDVLVSPNDVRGVWEEDVSQLANVQPASGYDLPEFDLAEYLKTAG